MSKLGTMEEFKTDEELEAAGPDQGGVGASAQQVSAQKQASAQQLASAQEHGKKIRRHLTGSIYLWACGERSEKDDDDICFSDVLIGWLVPAGLAYIMLIERAGGLSDSSTDNSNYSMASVTGAMYILVAFTTPDLRAGFSLLVDGFYLYHRVFGVALLILYGLMISAAMNVLFYSAGDDASVVINAVTVLFIAEVDEKALSFFATVPQEWRLFWAIYTVGISFALALVGLMYVGNAFVSVDDKSPNMNALDRVPGWFICVVNPGTVTVFSFYLKDAVRSFAEACCETVEDCVVPKWRKILVLVYVRSYKAVTEARAFFVEQPCFCVGLGLWLVHGVVAWWFLLQEFFGSGLECSSGSVNSTSSVAHSDSVGYAVSKTDDYNSPTTSGSRDSGSYYTDSSTGYYSSSNRGSSDSDSYAVRSAGDYSLLTSVGNSSTTSTMSIDGSDELYVALVVATVVLVVGFVLKAVVTMMWRHKRPRSVDRPQHSSQRVTASARNTWSEKFEVSPVPSLLLGWGGGYWITSCLMGGTLYSDGWGDRPLALKIAGYMILPWVFVALIIFKADKNFLGTKFEPLLEYTASILEDTRGGWFWIFATVIRDVVCIWLFMWYLLVPCLNNI